MRQFLVHPRKLLGLGDMTTVRATIRVLVAALIALGGSFPAWSGEVEEAHAALMRNDHAAALKKYKSAATKGNAQAQNEVGNLYAEGLAVTQDYVEAVRWYRMAAAKGFAPAQLQLAYIHDLGLGVAQDQAEAESFRDLQPPEPSALPASNIHEGWFLRSLS